MLHILEKKWLLIYKLNQKLLLLEEDLKKSQQTVAYLQTHGGSMKKTTKKLYGVEALMGIDFPAVGQIKHFKGHRDAITDMASHETESFLVTSSSDSTLRVYDVELNNQVALLRGHTHSVNGVDWYKDSIISAASDMTIRIWKSKNKQNSLDFDQFYCSKTLVGHEHSVSQIRVIENTQFAVSVSRDCTIKFWSLDQEICKRTIDDSVHEWLRCVDSNANFMVVAGNDTHVWVYDLGKILSGNNDNSSSNKLAKETLINHFPAHENVIEQISIGYKTASKNTPKELKGASYEHICVTASRDKLIKVFNFMIGECIISLSGHENWVKDVQFIPEKFWVISVGEDKTLRIWSIDKKKQIYVRKNTHQHFVNKMIFDLKRMQVYTGSVDKSCKVWKLMSENEFRCLGI